MIKKQKKKHLSLKLILLYFIFCISNTILGQETQNLKGYSSYNQSSSLIAKKSKTAQSSLNEWALKIFSLKERPVEFSALPNTKKYQDSILTLEQFKSKLDKVRNIIKLQLNNNSEWLNKKSLIEESPEIFNFERNINKIISKNFIFKPYAQKLLLKKDSKIILFGDLHGSVHTLIRSLLKLKSDGIIDNYFKIKNPNSYILFLGDYSDRGIYGLEVLYTILLLKIANPNNVFFVRGNHEDYNVSISNTKKAQPLKKEPIPGLIDEMRLKLQTTLKDEISIFRFYDILPVVIYLGTENNDHKHFIQCCHGGLEFGFDPKLLLNSDNIQFQRIYKLNRKKNFYSKLSERQRNLIKQNFDFEDLCQNIQNFTPKSPFEAGNKLYIGFMWNDFFVDKKNEIGPRGLHFSGFKDKTLKVKHFTGWVFGRNFTKELLKWPNSKKCTLHGIIRAHQHNNETGGPMLNYLCSNKGIVDIWSEGFAYCLVSAPSSVLENTCEQCFTYDSYIILAAQKDFKNWEIKHYWQDTSLENKIWYKKIIKEKTNDVQENQRVISFETKLLSSL